ncbi:hypothetical protein BD309DRAFT_893366 [Dichomitus squalens]|uniref:CCZ1/INTU/HSP4 first Longin domain-containing protein n=1 Tax=Dichomitus squalens TaxID=114155 RepID=A0A4Q9PKP1_9APHY|nr:hypothetical protein BD309DRAFT_893366 [Dichomitus squalens]TBU54694.1 hypothetical protein BD310DRAFT_858125 [Dichomitus squalens]
MSRIPPSLLYLTIYNPTLKPAQLEPDDEDAEEQAHILFYTAREHAVSRDRILRQVGLAKALVNFSEMFSAGVPCESVHSQARRMVMFSPEPNFWMHACYEVAKTPRPPPRSKGKSVPKGRSKGKETEKQQDSPPAIVYDYHDGSLHDLALRTHFQRGYEEFKLRHGTFNSILSRLGQEALELQLERFFTVWAWKWDVEDDDFGTHLGISLHPLHARLTPLLEAFASTLPDELITFALLPPHVIPPRSARYPASLVRHVLARIPPPATPIPTSKQSDRPSTVGTPLRQRPGSLQIAPTDVKLPPAQTESGFAFPLPPMPNMPAMPNMNFSLDMKNVKWGWPGYLTFGKGAGTSKGPSTPSEASGAPASLAAIVEGHSDPPKVSTTDDNPPPDVLQKDTLDVDTTSLLEAISTESIGSYTRAASPAPSVLSKSSQLGETSIPISVSTGGNVAPVDSADPLEVQVDGVPQIALSPPTSESAEMAKRDIAARSIRPFLESVVYLGVSGNPTEVEKHRLLHLTQTDYTIAIVAKVDHSLDLHYLADHVATLIEELRNTLVEEAQAGENHIPSATGILQPKDKHIVSMGEYTSPSCSGLISRSEHLYNGQELLRSGLDIHEVFSRGQNPQHWHIGKRGLGTTTDGRQLDGEVYLEVARKETTLTDVDNELAGLIRRFAEQV